MLLRQKRKQLYLIQRNKHREAAKMSEYTKKHGPNERIDQNSSKRAKQHGDKQSIRCRVENTGNRDAQRTHEYGNKIKKKSRKK